MSEKRPGGYRWKSRQLRIPSRYGVWILELTHKVWKWAHKLSWEVISATERNADFINEKMGFLTEYRIKKNPLAPLVGAALAKRKREDAKIEKANRESGEARRLALGRPLLGREGSFNLAYERNRAEFGATYADWQEREWATAQVSIDRRDLEQAQRAARLRADDPLWEERRGQR